MRRGVVAVALVAAACGGAPGGGGDQAGRYDAALLAKYRSVLPSEEKLEASAPASRLKSVGDQAAYPVMARDIATGVNGAVHFIVTTLRAVTDLPPTVYNSQTKEFFWGPFPDNQAFGWIGAYVREEPAGSDFKYAYAFLRGVDNDAAKLAPVIWGGINPDPANPDFGSGVTLWDFEAAYAFSQAHNPNHATQAHDRGRFVTLYGRGLTDDPNDGDATFTFNVAVFHQFVPKDKPGNSPANAKYFYGKYKGAFTLGFMDFAAGIDIANPADGSLEDVDIRVAFLGSGLGRAEVAAQCPENATCSLQADEKVTGVECWDNNVKRTYLNLSSTRQGGLSYSEGQASNCTAPFNQDFATLKIPSLADLDAELLGKMEEVARDGMAAVGASR